MISYDLSPTPDPRLIVEIDAHHAEVFHQSCLIVQRMMLKGGRAGSTLGVLKTHANYLVGRMDFNNNSVVEPVPVEEFGADLITAESRAQLIALRNNLTGHIRTIISKVMYSLHLKSIYLIFHGGGPVFITSPPSLGGNHRLGMLRFRGATDVKQEAICVRVNKASSVAFKEIWRTLRDNMPPPAPKERGIEDDVMDAAQALSSQERPLPDYLKQENEIDGLDGLDAPDATETTSTDPYEDLAF